MANAKTSRRNKIRNTIRQKLSGTAEKPRLAVFRSNTDIYAQLIDDTKMVTIAAASSKDKDITTEADTKTEKSKLVGASIAKKAVGLNVKKVVFDRGGYLYHGRVKALADGAREAGLEF
jgi:large subunit ribosomal protein L18